MYSFEQLCLPCYPELVAYAQKRTRCKSTAEDIVQESVVRALNAWDRWTPTGDPEVYARAWMFRIVANTFATQFVRTKNHNLYTGRTWQDDNDKGENHMARIHNTAAMQVIDALYQEPVTMHPALIFDEVSDEVQDALGRIHPEWAEVVRLVYMDGVPAQEAAKILGIAPGTVRSRMARGRLALARILSPLARARYGFTVKGETVELGGADEASDAFQATESEQTEAYTVDSVVGDYDDSTLLF